MENNKKPIGIVTDEAADLTREIIEKEEIRIISLNVHWPEIEEIPGENIFQKIREIEKRGYKSFAKTSQPSPKDFLDVFKKQLESFEKIICLTVTSKHSGTYNSGCQAKRFLAEEGERVFVVDSLNATCSQGLVVLKVADLIKKRLKVEEILKELEKFLPEVHLAAFLSDPKWLEASGRISSTVANLMRKMQNIGIRPLIGLKKGKITTVGLRTKTKDVPSALFRELETKSRDLRKKGKKIRLAITHGDNLEMAEELKEMIERDLRDIEIAFVNLIDDVLGVITGPDTLALAWAPIE